MKNLYIFLSLMVGTLFADNISDSFLNIPCGSRPSALGGAYIGLGDEVDVIFYNPSGLGLLKSSQLMFMHAQWFKNVKIENAGFAFQIKKTNTIGFGLRILTLDGIEVRDNPTDDPIEVSGASYFDIITGFSHIFAEKISIGANFHIIYQKIVNASSKSFACDSGFNYSTESRFFSFGFVVKNLGSKVKYINKPYSLPLTIGSGVAFRLIDSRLIIASDFNYTKGLGNSIHTGIETSIKNAISSRVGFYYNIDEKKIRFLAGMGFSFSGFGFDYTFQPFGNDLGVTHRFTLNYSFGRAKEHIEKEIEKRTTEELEEKERMMSNSLYQTGMNNYNEGRYDEAINAWDLALIWNPELVEAETMIERAKEEKRLEEIQSHLTKAQNQFNYGMISDAILECKNALEIDPSNVGALELLKKAEEENERRLVQKKENIRKLYDEALSYYSNGDFKRAIELWEEVLNIDPTFTDAKNSINNAKLKLIEVIGELYKKAMKYEETGNWLSALRSYRAILNIDPSNAEAKAGESRALKSITESKSDLLARGKELYNSGDYESAEMVFYQVLELSYDNNEAKSYISIISQKKKEKITKESIDYYSIYLSGINAYTDHKYITAIEYWKQIPPDNSLYSKAQNNIKRAQNILEKLK
ncbi:MAG: PorV/PorQ family protein [bacterium]